MGARGTGQPFIWISCDEFLFSNSPAMLRDACQALTRQLTIDDIITALLLAVHTPKKRPLANTSPLAGALPLRSYSMTPCGQSPPFIQQKILAGHHKLPHTSSSTASPSPFSAVSVHRSVSFYCLPCLCPVLHHAALRAAQRAHRRLVGRLNRRHTRASIIQHAHTSSLSAYIILSRPNPPAALMCLYR